MGNNVNAPDINDIKFSTQTVNKIVRKNADNTSTIEWVRHYSISQSLTGCNVTYNRTSTEAPGVSTGVISASDRIYHGDVITITYSAQTNWAINSFTVNGNAFTSGSSITVSGNVTVTNTAQGVAGTINVTINSGVGGISLTYVDITNASKTVNITTTSSITDAWVGKNYSWTASPSVNYTMNTASGSGTIAATNSISPTAHRTACTISVSLGTGVSSISLTYYDTTNTEQTVSFSSNGSVTNAWLGTSYSWSASASTGYTLTTSSGTGTVSYSNNIEVSANARATTINIVISSNVSSVTLNYKNTSGQDRSVSFSSNGSVTDAWVSKSYSTSVTATSNAYTTNSAPSGTISSSTMTLTPTVKPWARTIQVKFTDAHVTKIYLTYMKTDGTTVTNQEFTATGSVTDAWNTKTYSWSVVPQTGYAASPNGGSNITIGATNIIEPATVLFATTITVTINTNISSIAVSYVKTDGTNGSRTFTSSGSITDAWAEKNYSWTATAATNYVASPASGSTQTLPAAGVTIAPVANKQPRTITVTLNSNVSSINVTYYSINASGNTTTSFTTSGGTITDAWSGQNYSWTATAATGYTLSQSSGSGTLNSNITIAPTAGKNTYTLTITKNSGISTIGYKINAGSWVTTNTSKTVNIEYGDSIYWYATASTGYHRTDANASYTSSSNYATISNVAANQTIAPTAAINQYTIAWQNPAGTTIKTDTVDYGTVPQYSGTTPTKASTTQYNYEFSGWSPTPVQATANATYVAQFNSVLRYYNITWKDGNGSTLKTDSVAYGATPSYTGNTPTKTATAQYSYTWNNGWTPTIVAVSGNATYTATFTATLRTYTVTWKNYDGTTLETDSNVAYGTTPTYNGSTPTKSQDAQYSYTFNGWSPAVGAISGNTTYTAQFTPNLRSYTITFNNPSYGSWGINSKTAYYGDTLSLSGTTVTCSQGSSNTTRWTNSVSANSNTYEYSYTIPSISVSGGFPKTVGGAITVSASNTANKNSYTLSGTYTNGSVSWYSNSSHTAAITSAVEYGTTVYYALNGNTGYANGTSSSLTLNETNFTISGSTASKNFGSASRQSFSISFTNPDYGSWSSNSKPAYYGDTLTSTLSNGVVTVTCYQWDASSTVRWTNTCSAMATTDQYTYAITGNVSVTSPVTSNQTVTAPTSSRTERKYNVTFTNGDYGSWNNTDTISATYSTQIAITNSGSTHSVAVGSTTRTYSASTTGYTYSITVKVGGSTSNTTVGTGKAATVAVTREANTYNLSGTFTNGSVTWYSNSNHSTAITQATYGTTVYYALNGNTGYYDGDSGSLTLNETNFTLSGSTASKNFGSATRITWTATISKGHATSFRYKIDDGDWVSRSADTTINSLDFNSTVTANGTAFEAGYETNGSVIATRNNQSVTIDTKVIKRTVTVDDDADYVTSVFLNTNSTASGTTYASGTTFEYGTTVYGFATYTFGTGAPYSSGATLVSTSNNLYRVGSATVGSNNVTIWSPDGSTYYIYSGWSNPKYCGYTYGWDHSVKSLTLAANSSGTTVAVGSRVYKTEQYKYTVTPRNSSGYNGFSTAPGCTGLSSSSTVSTYVETFYPNNNVKINVYCLPKTTASISISYTAASGNAGTHYGGYSQYAPTTASGGKWVCLGSFKYGDGMAASVIIKGLGVDRGIMGASSTTPVGSYIAMDILNVKATASGITIASKGSSSSLMSIKYLSSTTAVAYCRFPSGFGETVTVTWKYGSTSTCSRWL